jgi:hypothetical protein
MAAAMVDTTWQGPAKDDINPDALEYFFISRQKERSGAPPWVEILSEPQDLAKTSPDTLRLRTKVELLAGEVDLLSNRLQQANCQVGYLLAQLAEKDRLLQTLPQFRLSAARAAYSYRSSRSNAYLISMDLLIFILMVGIAWAMLMTVLT